jgi:NAD(P)-dependent dehydrogenase (short-subunit alcohol dehydrogenase family)
MSDQRVDPDLHPLKVLVTGSTSGIGRAVALKLARDGFEVIVHGRDTARGVETVEEITRSGGRARFVLADLGDPAGVQRLVEDAGDIDVLGQQRRICNGRVRRRAGRGASRSPKVARSGNRR